MFSCNDCPMTSPLDPSIHQLKISLIHTFCNDFWIHKGAFTFTFTTISALPCDQVCSVFTHHLFVLPLLRIQQTSLVNYTVCSYELQKLQIVFDWRVWYLEGGCTTILSDWIAPKSYFRLSFQKLHFWRCDLISAIICIYRDIYMRVQNSVYNWIEASFTQCERWDLGSENEYCFWNYFHRHLWNRKGQIIYSLHPAPAFFFFCFFTPFVFSFPIFWFLKSGEFLLEKCILHWKNTNFQTSSLQSLPCLPCQGCLNILLTYLGIFSNLVDVAWWWW